VLAPLLLIVAAAPLQVRSADPVVLAAARAAAQAVELTLAAPDGGTAWLVDVQEQGGFAAVVVVDPARKGADGRAQVKVTPVKSQWRERALTAAFKQALPRALEDLEQRAKELKGQGARKVRFSLELNRLDGTARTFVKETTLPCLTHRLELVGKVTGALESQGFLEEDVEYVPSAEEPRDGLAYQVEQAQRALTGGPREACSTFGTPLQGFSTHVRADVLNRAVVVTFRR